MIFNFQILNLIFKFTFLLLIKFTQHEADGLYGPDVGFEFFVGRKLFELDLIHVEVFF